MEIPAMKKTFALLVASTALSAALGLAAFSASRDAAGDGPGSAVSRPDGPALAPQLMLASDDHDDDDGRWRDSSRRGHDDDDDDDDDEDEDDDDCDEDDDDGNCRGAARNPAPAGTVAPPQNGLFGNGAPPRVQMN
jgi:hypothetical protein